METASTTTTGSLEVRFGPLQGLWLIGGYLLASFLGSLLVGIAWGTFAGISAGAHGSLPVPSKPGIGVLAWSVLVGTLLAAAWGVTYPIQIAKPLLRVGDAHGIAWRRAPARGYLIAIGFAIVIVAIAWELKQLIPPDLSKLTGPLEQLGRSHGWPRVVVLLLALVVAPPVEEFVFRGALLAAFARRWGTPIAVLLSTGVFVLFHIADKIHYWPGFVDVALLGLAAVFVRLRYRSLWPALLLHFLYNGLLFLI